MWVQPWNLMSQRNYKEMTGVCTFRLAAVTCRHTFIIHSLSASNVFTTCFNLRQPEMKEKEATERHVAVPACVGGTITFSCLWQKQVFQKYNRLYALDFIKKLLRENFTVKICGVWTLVQKSEKLDTNIIPHPNVVTTYVYLLSCLQTLCLRKLVFPGKTRFKQIILLTRGLFSFKGNKTLWIISASPRSSRNQVCGFSTEWLLNQCRNSNLRQWIIRLLRSSVEPNCGTANKQNLLILSASIAVFDFQGGHKSATRRVYDYVTKIDVLLCEVNELWFYIKFGLSKISINWTMNVDVCISIIKEYNEKESICW